MRLEIVALRRIREQILPAPDTWLGRDRIWQEQQRLCRRLEDVNEPIHVKGEWETGKVAERVMLLTDMAFYNGC